LLGSLLALGLLLGLRHALEADHVSTVATLASRSASKRQTISVAAAWGLGHTVSLALLGTLLAVLGATLPDRAVRILEVAVGVILVALGIGVFRRLTQKHLHVHVHEHDGLPHLHAHTHGAETDSHEHVHVSLKRSLAIGGVHGLAGTAAVTVLALPAARSAIQALLYLIVFGVGSMLGMIALSFVVSLPFHAVGRRLGRLGIGLQALLGLADVAIGAWVVLAATKGI
jgi:sulfite exporter TauE/SafE